MASVVVVGGSVIGLCTAMVLARDGHRVTVLEGDRDGAPATPEEAWASWDRRGVAQFRQPHNLFPRFREGADALLPGLTDRLLAAGCVWVDPLGVLPPTLDDRAPRPGDERLRFVTGRRPVVESAVAAAAEDTPGVTVRRGVRVAGLLAGPPAAPGVPHVAGVRTTDGEEVRADLVVDAGGRRTAAAAWLADLGARPPLTDSQDSGFVYYTRYFTGPERPPRRAPGLAPYGSISVLTLDGDNDTWSVTVYGRSTDRPLKALRDPAAFARVVGACPRQAHWLAGRPITGVLAMAGIQDRYRSFVVDGRPVVTGFAAVGDSWACTNPSAGRGLSVGMAQVQQLREAVAEALDDPVRLALTYHERTERHVAPFYRGQLEADRLRTAEMAAAADGAPPPQPDPTTARWQAGTAYSAELFRAFLEGYFCLATPAELAARPAVQRALERTGTAPPPRLPGPDRAALLELLAG